MTSSARRAQARGLGFSWRLLIAALAMAGAACGPQQDGPSVGATDTAVAGSGSPQQNSAPVRVAAAVIVPESRGREFILSFHPSLEANAQTLTVQLHLTSDVETNVTIEYPVRTPTFVQTVVVVPGQIAIVDLPTDASFSWSRDAVSNNAVHATGSAPFTVYMVNSQRLSSDAALGLPVNALNTRYVALDWNVFDGAQLSVTAAYDNTDVSIIPSSDWPGHPAGVPFTVTLDRGEGYFTQLSRPTYAQSEGLTGTQIEASLPVQVTTGNGCVLVPNPFGACDHVFEVAQPVQTWGRTVPVVHPNTRPGAFYRIVAAEDGTLVELDGVPLGTLDRGGFLQTAALYDGHVFQADGPIFVAQFVPSQSAPVSDGQGDPAMGNMVPAEQYLERYTFSTVGDNRFVRHQLTVIAHDEETDTLLLDGFPIGADVFAPISGTDLSTATVELAEGTHTTFSRLGHGIGIYGFNNFDSYLYPGGSRFATIESGADVDPPICSASFDTGAPMSVVGSGRDAGSGVFAVALEDGAVNLSLAVDPFQPGDENVSYRVTRSSPMPGGRGLVTVTDGSGNICQQQIDLALTGDAACLDGVFARATIAAAQLTWTADPGAERYSISRGINAAGPFIGIGETTSDYATYLDETAPLDSLHYYRVERVPADGSAPCVSAPVAVWVPAVATRMTAVPDLVGRPEADAESALAAAGLAIGSIGNPSSAQPPGLVVSQDPPRGSFVGLGMAVAFGVSAGPSDVSVPDVVGQTEIGAELLLSSVELLSGAITLEATDAQPSGRVLRQSPSPGATVAAGTRVDLVVATAIGPVSVPDVVGQDEAAAASILAAVGLGIGVSTPAPHYLAPVGEVIDQRPRAGSILDPGSSVDLVVSAGPAADNGPPIFSSMPVLVAAMRSQPLTLTLRATDPDGDPLTFSLQTAPPGMTIDAVTGLIDWLPGTDRLGERQTVSAIVTDPSGAAGSILFAVLVQNYRPYFVSSPPDQVVRGETLRYAAVAHDPDGDAPVYSLDTGAPDGANIDPDTGLLTWTPAPEQAGSFFFGLRASDPFNPLGLADVQSFAMSVPNAAPVFGSTPPGTATRGILYSYTPVVSDPDGDPITFSILGVLVEGMSFDPISGRIDWVPERHQVGDFFFFLRASDPFSAGEQQSISIHVPNATPVVTSTPITTATRDMLYEYDVEATDADGDPITFALQYGPVGMTIDPVTGLIRWTPGSTQEGSSSVAIRASDVSGTTAFQSFSIAVPAVNDPPRITSSPSLNVDEDAPYAYAVIANDPEFDALTFALTAAPVGMTIDPISGLVSWTPGQDDVGAKVISLRVSDPGGLSDVQTYVLQVRDLDPDPNPPVVVLFSPPADGEVRMPVDVVASVEDDNLARYLLELRPGGAPSGSILAEGFTPVTAATIGRIDPTLLENGLYSLRLTAEDAAGNVTVAEQTVIVAGSFKPGHFALHFTDLSITLAGLPIRIGREYDSRRRNEANDLGFGWRLGVTSDARYVHNRTPGLDWLVSSSGGFPDVPCSVANETRSHFTEIRFSDTEFYRFGFRVEMFGLGSATFDGCIGLASFDQIGGIPGATLDILGNTDVLYQLEEILDFDPFSSDFLNPFQARDVRLTTADGRVFDLRLGVGLTRIEDANGNALFIQTGGVIHDNGTQVEFVRDAEGRVERVIDPGGFTIDYVYDGAGDLVSVIGLGQQRSRFTYDEGHLLLDYFDPSGNRPIRNEYDATGRLVAQTDADDGRHQIDTDLVNRITSVTDPLGATSTALSDAEGNLVEATLADGGVARFTHDARGNVLTETDPLGQTRSFMWDSADLLLSETNALGFTNAYSWLPDGRLDSMAGAAGDSVDFAYDPSGNLIEARDANGTVLQAMTYDGIGQLGSIDTLGGITEYLFDSLGRVQQQNLPGGGRRSFVRDIYGRVTQERVSRTDGFGRLVFDETRFTYDATGHLLSRRDPLGHVMTYAYDAAGLLRARTDPRGYRTTFEYDGRGNVIRVDHPDGTLERSTYDAAGRRTAVTDRAGRTTFYSYDELGRLLETLYADGTRVTRTYDAGGRPVTRTDALGNATHFEYDAAGHVVRRTDPGGHVSTFEYDGDGTRTASIDALGRRTELVYDRAAFLAPQLRQTIFPDGSIVGLEYAANGRLSTRTDETGLATNFVYDAEGRLESVLNAAGETTRYGYDEVGNRVTETDALGRTTRLVHDGNRRLLRRTLPGGEFETFQYDSAGNRIGHTSFSGQVTAYRYDSMNRVERKDLPDGRSVLYGYTPNGLLETVEDARGITRYVYDLRDRLIEIREPDGEVIAHTYDAEGRLLSITAASGTTGYVYDALGRMTDVSDPQGNTTQYSYDSVGNVILTTRSNGTSTEYGYDARNRVVSVRHLGPGGAPVLAAFDYTFDSAGRRTRVDESGGRARDYLYDAVERLIEERETLAPDAFLTRYDYDAVGQRIRVDRNGVITDYGYDINGRLTSVGAVALGWDIDGRLVSREEGGDVTGYVWDSEDRLVTVSTPDGLMTRFAYDDEGRRVERDQQGVITRFLVDPAVPGGYPQAIAELDGAGSLLATHTFGLGRIGLQRGASEHTLHADALGSTRLLTDGTGAATDLYDYDAFGRLLNTAGSSLNEALFRGELFEPALGMYDLRARWMSPESGLFASRDALAGDPFEPRSLARYPFAFSDPVNKLDPSGAFTLYELGVSNSVSTLFGTSVVASFIVSAAVEFSVVEGLRAGVLGKRLNERSGYGKLGTFGPTGAGIGYGGSGGSIEQKISFDFGFDLGGGAVESAFKLSGSLTGTSTFQTDSLASGTIVEQKIGSAFEIVNELFAMHASRWMLELPAAGYVTYDEDRQIFLGQMVPGRYLACGFNDYVYLSYDLKLMKSLIGPGSKQVDLGARIVGVWLAYTNVAVLQIETAADMALSRVSLERTTGSCDGAAGPAL